MRPTFRLILSSIAASLFASGLALGADAELRESDIDAVQALIDANPSEFTGFSVDAAKREIVVHHVARNSRASAHRSLLQAVRKHQLAKQQQNSVEPKNDWTVRYVSSNHSRKDLEEVFARIQTAEPWKTLAKPVLSGWGVDIENDVVAIEVTAVTPELFAETNRQFGSKAELRVVPKDNIRYSRSNDSPSWYGGIPIRGLVRGAVWDNQIERCTAGFAVTDQDGTITGLVTAGHCFSNGAAIRQADNEYVGGVIHNQLTNNGLDLALVGFGDSYQGAMWVNESTATWVHPSAASNPNLVRTLAVGDVVCFNGAITGEKCNARITNLNNCQVFAGISTCKLVSVASTNNAKIAGGGDSGGPVYTRYNGYIWPRGIIIGGNPAGTIAHYHSIATVLGGLNVAPNLVNSGSCCWNVMTLW